MKVYIHKFQLTPLRKLNSKSTLQSREGVFLKSVSSKVTNFWEYFPHPELGDQSVESFLNDFASAKTDAQKKAHLRLTNPLEGKTDTHFLNHELYQKNSTPKSSVIKYKIHNSADFDFIPLLENGHIIRLDANGIFNHESWKQFKSNIPEKDLKNIEYIEDPLMNSDWSKIGLKTASDFINGTPCSVKVYKPYRELYPMKAGKIIFSAPMGHILGSYLTFLEMVHFGDLKLHHGLITPDIYKEVPNLFSGDFNNGFFLNKDVIDSFLNSLDLKKWGLLCTV